MVYGLEDLIEEKDTQYFYEIGKQVGEKLKTLKQLKMDVKYINQVDDLMTKVQEWFGLLEAVPDEVVYRYLSKVEVEDIKQKMMDYTQYFKEEDKCFVHTDMKLGNLMLANGKLYFVDIEGTEYDYDVFNILGWPVGKFRDTRKGDCEAAFQKGLFEGFDLQRSNLDKQILFMYMAKFCFSTYTKYKRKQDLDFLMLYRNAYDRTNQFTKLDEGKITEKLTIK